jgi:hypothetical protein
MGWEGTLRIVLLRFKLSMSALENEPAMGGIQNGVACALESKSFTKHMLRL